MVFKLKIERYVERPKNPPIKLKIERVLDTPKKTKRVYKKRAPKTEGGTVVKKKVSRKKKVSDVKQDIPIVADDIHETKVIVESDDSSLALPQPLGGEDIVKELGFDPYVLPDDAFQINTGPGIEDEVNSPENMIDEKIISAIEGKENNETM